jgi:hypothetical protein
LIFFIFYYYYYYFFFLTFRFNIFTEKVKGDFSI